MADNRFTKDPNTVKDFKIDWSTALGDTDTISTSDWTVPSGLTEDSATTGDSDTSATIWLSGGTAGQNYWVTNRIVTTPGARTYDRSLLITVCER